MNCKKEIQLKRGWACVVEGVYVPEGALVLTRPPHEIAAYREEMGKAFSHFLEEENLAENTLVITDGKGETYAFVMPGAKLTVVLYVEKPWAEADLLIRYLDGTLRGYFIDRSARRRFYERGGLLLSGIHVAAPKHVALSVEPSALAQPAAAEAPAEGTSVEARPAAVLLPNPASSSAVVAALSTLREEEEAALPGASGQDAGPRRLPGVEELCEKLRRDPVFLDLVAAYAVVYDKRPEKAKAVVEELRAWL